MEEPTLTLAELLAEAAAAASLGDRAEAGRLYRRATERSPGNSTAWLGLAAAVDSPEEKRACYERVLSINPNNGEARIALQRLASMATPEQASAIQETLSNAAALVAADPARYEPDATRAATNGNDHEHVPVAADQTLYCANHPETETTLRCNRCGKPVCVRCVELTEVGYRCKDCIRQQQNTFFTAETKDYFILAIVSFGLAALATPFIELLLGMLGLFFGIILAVFLGPAVGGAAATIIRRSVGRRRGRYMGLVGVIAIIAGVGFGLVVASMFGIRINLIPMAVFLFLSLSTIYATLR